MRHHSQTSPAANCARLVLELERQALELMAERLLALTDNYRHRPRSEKRIDMSKASTRQRYYTFADEVLAGRARRGDTGAETVLEHRRAVQRMCTKTKEASSSRDHCCCLTEEVRLHFRKSRERPGRVQMFLEIEELALFEAIKKQWKEIRTWRDLLLEWQGPSPSGMNGFFYQLHLDHRRGQSYAAIAARLNASMCSTLEMVTD